MSASAASPCSLVASVFPGVPPPRDSRLPHRASPLARAALQNRLKAPSLKIVGAPPPSTPLASNFPTRRPMCCWLTRQVNHPRRQSNRSPTLTSQAEIPIVVLTESAGPAASAQALQAGIRAVLPSDISADQLAAALQAAAAGLVRTASDRNSRRIHANVAGVAVAGRTPRAADSPRERSPTNARRGPSQQRDRRPPQYL